MGMSEGSGWFYVPESVIWRIRTVFVCWMELLAAGDAIAVNEKAFLCGNAHLNRI